MARAFFRRGKDCVEPVAARVLVGEPVGECLRQRLHVRILGEATTGELRFRMQRQQHARGAVVGTHARLRIDDEHALVHLRDHQPIYFELVLQVPTTPGRQSFLHGQAR